MNPPGEAHFFSSSKTVAYRFYNFHNDQPTPQSQTKATEIPIQSPSDIPAAVTVRLHPSESAAAVTIQAAYRSHTVRALVREICAVDSEATRLERLIQRQDTVDAVRHDQRERLRINEALMALLLRLDSVPGRDPAVRELRRSVSHRIVGLQEILDAVCDARVEDWDGFLQSWDEAVAEIENDVCRERGGPEMERFCAENLGFRCLQRFLSQS